MMKQRRKCVIASVAFAWGCILMAAEATSSAGALIYLNPDASSLWRTVKGHSLTVPIDYPDAATKATLEVQGVGYYTSYSVIAGDFSFTLPAATTPRTENVYDLTLTFDDGTVRKAKLGVVQGTDVAGEGATRCVFDTATSAWSTFVRRAVMPIPAGTTSFLVNGQEVDTGLNGACGWYALAADANAATTCLALTTAEEDYLLSVTGRPDGFILTIR